MNPILRFKRVKVLLAVAAIGLGTAAAGMAYAGSLGGGPTSAFHYTVTVGGGAPTDFANLQYTPTVLDIYAGDSVTFVNHSGIEPHTITFGPKKMLGKLVAGFITPVAGAGGPPTLVFSSKVVQPTKRTTYNGKGFANSGILSPLYHGVTRTSWTIKFTKPGRFEYHCLIHFPSMVGWIVVHPRPMASTSLSVQAGYGANKWVADTYFPEDMTVHVGDTVTWSAFFHTVTFAPNSFLMKTRRQFVLTTTKNGKKTYSLNPAVAFPSSTNGCGMAGAAPCQYSGGYLSSGLLQGSAKGPSTFAVTFMKPGLYHYGCLVHPGMEGNIRVVS